MERIMVVVYKPYKGKEEILMSLLLSQVKVYREEGLSSRDPWFMRSKDSTYLGFYHWKSKAVVDSLETHPAIQEIWRQFEKICSFEKPSSVSEFQEMFSDLEAIDFDQH